MEDTPLLLSGNAVFQSPIRRSSPLTIIFESAIDQTKHFARYRNRGTVQLEGGKHAVAEIMQNTLEIADRKDKFFTADGPICVRNENKIRW